MLNFRKCLSPADWMTGGASAEGLSHWQHPWQEWELFLGECPTGIYWPTLSVHEFMIEDVKTQYGLDVETEAFQEVTEQLCKDWNVFEPRRARLEIVVALGTARALARRTAQPVLTILE